MNRTYVDPSAMSTAHVATAAIIVTCIDEWIAILEATRNRLLTPDDKICGTEVLFLCK